MASASAVRVDILGPLRLERDGEPVELSGGRLRALLTRLALDAGRPVTTSALVDAVWDNDLPSDEQHALQSLVSRLRRSVGDVLEATPGGYRLAVAPDAVDAARFERLVAEGRPREALALWRGPSGIPQLEEARLRALLVLDDATLPELEAAVAEHPLNEKLAARYITALAAAGRQADALSAYEHVRVRLDEELGALPSPELAEAHLAVLKVPVRRTSNLRAPVTSFVGREPDLQRIDELLATARLVTLVGPGGAGKTRLAGEALARWVDRVDGGVWMVELAPVTAEVEIVPAALAALGLREGAVLDRPGATLRDGLERLIDALIDRDTILFLDNCEHLIAAAAAVADTLLAACPGLRIVATSREPLAIAGENLVPVTPLADDPAVELFLDRARAVSPGFASTPAVAEICRRLDGLPLAIELAAARLRTMPVEQIAARLDDRFRLLTGGSRAALPRHRTLRAVVDWSWGLLDEDERVLARRLAVFQAGATEESAAAVCGVDDALDGLTALAERSLRSARTALSHARDDPRVRAGETRGGGRGGGHALGARAMVRRARRSGRTAAARLRAARLVPPPAGREGRRDRRSALVGRLRRPARRPAPRGRSDLVLGALGLAGGGDGLDLLRARRARRDRPDRPADRRGHHAARGGDAEPGRGR